MISCCVASVAPPNAPPNKKPYVAVTGAITVLAAIAGTGAHATSKPLAGSYPSGRSPFACLDNAAVTSCGNLLSFDIDVASVDADTPYSAIPFESLNPSLIPLFSTTTHSIAIQPDKITFS